MKVDVNSWHYRLYKQTDAWYDRRVPRDFCSYFWNVFFFALWRWLLLPSLAMLILGLFGFMAFLPLIAPGEDFILTMFISTIMWCIAGLALAEKAKALKYSLGSDHFLIKQRFLFNDYKYIHMPKPKVYKEPGFFATAWKSYKEKTCVPIELIDSSRQ